MHSHPLRLNRLNKYGDVDSMTSGATQTAGARGVNECGSGSNNTAAGKNRQSETAKLASLLAPDGLRGLVPGAPVSGLDRSKFSSVLPLVSVKLAAKLCNSYLKKFRDQLFVRPRMKRVFNTNNTTAGTAASALAGAAETVTDARYMLLSADYTMDNAATRLSAELRTYLVETGGTLEPFDLLIDYDSLSVEEVLKQVLPATVEERAWVAGSSSSSGAYSAVTQGEETRTKVTEIPSSYEQVGTLAHMNIREELWPYKYIIGQVLLDKHYPTIKTVINKTGTIENEFRTFPMEVIAGQDSFDCEVRESGAKFKFNFRDVYWNSRLGTEHNRLIKYICDDAAATTGSANADGPLIVADLMAGVGPFAVPLALSNMSAKESASNPNRRKLSVFANDLNPASYAALNTNRQINNIGSSSGSLSTFNTCGRKFIRKMYQDLGAEAGKALARYLASGSTAAAAAAQPSHAKAKAEAEAFQWARAPTVAHCIMNLPQNATDFLDAFIGVGALYTEAAVAAGTDTANNGSSAHAQEQARHAQDTLPMPRIHVYGFSTDPIDPIADMARRAAATMGCPVEALYGSAHTFPAAAEGTTAAAAAAVAVAGGTMTNSYGKSNEFCAGTIVRDVAPTKLMICLTFVLPREVAFAAAAAVVSEEPDSKKRRTGSDAA